MALRAVPDHPKFAHLKSLLNLPKGAALGYLECIWHFAGRFTPQGNIGKYSDSAIESWVEWPGEPGSLIAALVESRWLDRDETHRLLVHDWAQHADKAAKMALQRAKLEFCSPTVGTVFAHRGNVVPQLGNGVGTSSTGTGSSTGSSISSSTSYPQTPEGGFTTSVPDPECQLAAENFAVSNEGRSEVLSEGHSTNGNGASKKTPLNTEVETVLDQVARRIQDRHPPIRRCGIAEVKKQLRAIARKAPAAQRIELLYQIDRNHAAWCVWPEWHKDAGQYAKGLDNWLAPTKERWKEPPPESSPERISSDEVNEYGHPRLMM